MDRLQGQKREIVRHGVSEWVREKGSEEAEGVRGRVREREAERKLR